jgi:branched-chain amino acid transport system substrate-binding protein
MKDDSVARAKTRRWRLLAAAAVSLMAAAACGGSTSSSSGTQAANGTPIKIGVLDDNAPSTGIEGAEMRVNTDLAIAQINSAGGIHGHPLQAVYADPKGDPAQAVNMAQQLVQNQGADVLAGAVLSSECLGVENLVPRLQVVYMASTGCAAEAFTSAQCNAYSFRVSPSGRQGIIPLSNYIVKQYGSKWSIIYPDYAFGTSQLAAYKVGMSAAGGEISQQIAIPQNEANMTPYVTQIKTDGSVNGLINSEVSADLVRSSQAIAQFGISTKMPVVGVFGKERFGGVYPDSLTGDIGQGPELSDSAQDNKFDQAYHTAFKAQLAKEDANLVTTVGGAVNAVPGGLGYQAYSTMMALKHAMLSANFTGKADSQKLISSLAGLNVKQSADFPGGDMTINKNDHQGVQTTYIVKINGQKEQVLSTVAPANLPPIGSCIAK